MRANTLIRELAAATGVRHWEIAARMNVSETRFCAKLRFELTMDESAEIINTIRSIAYERGEEKKFDKFMHNLKGEEG